MSDEKEKKEKKENNPLVLYVKTMEFEPTILVERRQLTVDIEILDKDIEQLIEKLIERRKFVIKTPIRIRFVGTPI